MTAVDHQARPAMHARSRAVRYRLRTRLVTIRRPSRAVDSMVRCLGIHPSLTTPDPQADLVVDGFQGSANSLFCDRFADAQVAATHLIGHVHSPVMIRAAIEQDIPTVILIRRPAGAVVSTLSRWPYIPPHVALRTWQRFYTYLMPVRAGAVIATFEQAVTDLGEVVDRVNARFGTSFERPAPAPNRPVSTSDRERRKAVLHDALLAVPGSRRLLEGCDGLYGEFVS
jgi:hypothetical protein